MTYRMTTKQIQRRHKLRDAVRRRPSLINEIRDARLQGYSYTELAYLIYDLTGVRVTTYAVREWVREITGEGDGDRD